MLLKLFSRSFAAKSTRNKSTVWVGKHKLARTPEEHRRRLDKHKPFVLGRDNVVRDFTPISIPDHALSGPKDYRVLRTRNGSLPVYTEYKNGRSNMLTIIRRIDGKAEKVASDLAEFIPGKLIDVKHVQNHVVIKGNVQRSIRYWMTALGF